MNGTWITNFEKKTQGLGRGILRENGEEMVRFSSDACMLIYRQSLGQFGN